MPASPVLTIELFTDDTTNPANKILDLDLSSRVEYLEGDAMFGDGRVSLPLGTAQATQAISDDPRIIRITQDGDPTKAFEFFPTRISRGIDDEQKGTVTVSGPGTRSALTSAIVAPYGNCPPTESTTQRILGYQDPGFDITGLALVEEYGTFRAQRNFFTSTLEVRAEGMADPFAAFITNATGPAAVGEVLYFSPTFTVTEAGTYIMQVCGDDEYDSFLIGSLIGSARGKYQWKEADNYLVDLCPGVDYRWVIRGNNLSTQYDGTELNKHWVIGAIVEANADGKAAAANEIWHISTDAEGGYLTLRPSFSATSVNINFDDTTASITTKLESIPEIGTGNVSVSGQGTSAKNDAYDFWYDATVTGGSFTITVDGQVATINYGDSAATIATKVEALSTVQDVTVTGTGTSADKFRMEFVGADAQTDFSVSFNGSGLTGGGLNHTQVSNGSILDPWIIEFVGILGYANVGSPILTSSLVGGTITFTRAQAGDTAASIIRTSTDWVCIPYPATPRGLTAGHMIRIVAEEAAARGDSFFDLIALDFTDLVDSNGDAWSTEYEFAISPYSTSVADVVAFLEMSGLKVKMAPGFVLQVFQTSGFNRTATVDISNARFAPDSAFAKEKEIANVLYSETNDGRWIASGDADSVTAYRRWEIPYSAPEGPELTVGSWQQRALRLSKRPYSEHTLITIREEHPDGTTDQTPFTDYDWGDAIVAQGIDGAAETMMVSGQGLRRVDTNAAVEFKTMVTTDPDIAATLPTPGA